MGDFQPPFVVGAVPAVPGIHNDDANASYVNGDPARGIPGSIVPAEAFEWPQRELVAAINAAGITPSHNRLNQIAEAMSAAASGGVSYSCVAGMAANNFILSPRADFVGAMSPFDGQLITFAPPAANTGATTATWAGMTKPLRKWAGDFTSLVELGAGDLAANRPTSVIYLSADDALIVLPWGLAEQARRVSYITAQGTESRAGSSDAMPVRGLATIATDTNVLQGTGIANSILTIGAADAGRWQINIQADCGISPPPGVDNGVRQPHMLIQLWRNGVFVSQERGYSFGNVPVSHSDAVNLAANDTIELRAVAESLLLSDGPPLQDRTYISAGMVNVTVRMTASRLGAA